jgi:PDZ domain
MRAVLVLSALLVAGCASGYSQFYKAAPGATPDAIARVRSGPAPKEPALVHDGGNSSDVLAAYVRQGYVAIGYSSFNSGHRESDANAVSQGEKVGADLVVVFDPRYTGSVTSSVPMTTPTSSTSYTSGTASAYGSGGMATAYGNSTTTTYGSQTTYVPMTVHRFDYGALYLIKRHYIFGANFRDANDDERRTLQSNKGVYVVSVVNGTPAFKADVLVGDMIIAIDDAPVFGQQGCFDLLGQKRGQTIKVSIVRGGQTLTKTVPLDN